MLKRENLLCKIIQSHNSYVLDSPPSTLVDFRYGELDMAVKSYN